MPTRLDVPHVSEEKSKESQVAEVLLGCGTMWTDSLVRRALRPETQRGQCLMCTLLLFKGEGPHVASGQAQLAPAPAPLKTGFLCVALADPKLRDPSASPSQALGLKLCTTDIPIISTF